MKKDKKKRCTFADDWPAFMSTHTYPPKLAVTLIFYSLQYMALQPETRLPPPPFLLRRLKKVLSRRSYILVRCEVGI